MADREFVFGHPEVRKILQEKFIPLAMDDWYLRRQNDDNGKFFIAMTEASPRAGVGDDTRQGRYVFTAAGKFLGFNNNRGPDRILAMLRKSLAAFEKLPAAERAPQEGTGEVKPEPRFFRPLPKNGAVVKVYTRVLEREPNGPLRACAAPEGPNESFEHRGFGAAIDHFWLREEDVKRLIPDRDATASVPVPFPEVLAQRMARFHLADNTRGEPPHWRRDEVKAIAFTVTPESPVRAKLSGTVHLETKDGRRGFAGTLDGWLEHRNGKLTELKAAVTGEHWGDSPLTRGARPGKTPVGFAFLLCADPKPADRVPPQASRWLEGYYEPDRN